MKRGRLTAMSTTPSAEAAMAAISAESPASKRRARGTKQQWSQQADRAIAIPAMPGTANAPAASIEARM